MKRLSILLLSLGTCTAAWPAQAQERNGEAPNAQHPTDDEDMIIVTGQKPVGSVVGDIGPEVTFTPADIRSFGVSSISDLIAELAPQTASGQGRGSDRPVVLLNGKRVSSFSEIRDIPTEAIQRLEILPEEVALRYGYQPNQKVVNIVLRRRFKAFTGELEAAMPTEGGQFSPEIDTSYLRIGDFGRLNIALKYERSSALYESERDIIPQEPRLPYDIVGNITAASRGAEIDPALSALLGRPATVIGVPASAASRAPVLADFAGGGVNFSDIGRYRTLLPQTDALTLNTVFARTIFGNVSASFNGTLTYNESDSAQGLAGVRIGLPAASPYSPFAGDTAVYRYLGEFGALGQQSRDISGHFGMTFNGGLGQWQWTLTSNVDRTNSRTTTDRGFDISGLQAGIDALDPLLNPFAPLGIDQISGRLTDRARSIATTGDIELVMNGSLLRLPAGDVSTTVKLGGATSDFDARSIRSGVTTIADLTRRNVNGQISFDLPVASRKKGFLEPLGELSVNFNAAYNRLSDFGDLRTLGAGINWTPVKPLTLIASVSKDEGAPTVQQLGNPLVATAGVRVFDYIQGETVDITRITGGNAGLSADDRRVFKLGATLKPLTGTDLTLSANYTNARVRDPVASFPTATAAIEAAFPGRFTRDATGRLVQIDSRPINFARQDQEELRWGINFSKQLSTPPRPAGKGPRDGQQISLRDILPPGPGGDRPGGGQQGGTGQGPGGDRQQGAGGPGAGGQGAGGPGAGGPGRFAGGPPGGGFGRGPGGRGTRLQLALYHTIHLRERILVFEGGPELDLLNGDAIGSSGGQSRHEVQAQAGLTHNGLGARLSASWQSETTVNGGATGAQTLRFSDLATFNLRLFANLGQQQALTSRIPFLRGSRLSFSVTNIFNSRQHVTDVNGDTPVSYQPAYLDPLGRSVRISFRKLFF